MIGGIVLTACSNNTAVGPDPCTDAHITILLAGAPVAALQIQVLFGDHCNDGDVTAHAQFASSDPSVVVVSATGLVQAVGPGDAMVSATYKGLSASQLVRVLPGEPPLLVGNLDVNVHMDSPVGPSLSGATVEIIAGIGAGQIAIQSPDGFYEFRNITIPPTLTVRATAPGYAPAIVNSSRNGYPPGIPDIVLTRTQ